MIVCINLQKLIAKKINKQISVIYHLRDLYIHNMLDVRICFNSRINSLEYGNVWFGIGK